ncbi:MAG: bis(5'-nucleosyl)-tetraphosphatase (symmetrical) YqeK [bacterium]
MRKYCYSKNGRRKVQINNEQDIRTYIKNTLSKSRYEHSCRVYKSAIELANHHNIKDLAEVKIAALAHDILKETSPKTLGENINLETYEHYPKIWHALSADIFLKKKFNIKNEKILKAIKYHTTGNEKMNTIGKIIYIADYIEEKRKIKFRKTIEKLSYKNLNTAMYLISKIQIHTLKRKNKKIHPLSIKCQQYYRKLYKKNKA